MIRFKMIQFISIVLLVFTITGCGGGGGGASFSDNTVYVDTNGNYVVSGGGSSSSSSSSSNSSGSGSSGGGSSGGSSTISINIDSCPVNSPALNGTTVGSITETVQSGDKIVKDSATASIKFTTYSDGTKNVCVVSGTAHVER